LCAIAHAHDRGSDRRQLRRRLAPLALAGLDLAAVLHRLHAEHTATTILLDARGVQRVGYATSVLTPEDLAHDIALLEREAATSA
jgi:hypothetical protein